MELKEGKGIKGEKRMNQMLVSSKRAYFTTGVILNLMPGYSLLSAALPTQHPLPTPLRHWEGGGTPLFRLLDDEETWNYPFAHLPPNLRNYNTFLDWIPNCYIFVSLTAHGSERGRSTLHQTVLASTFSANVVGNTEKQKSFVMSDNNEFWVRDIKPIFSITISVHLKLFKGQL